ncbi:hypothetical protein [Klebsiella phage KA]|uniref:Uncharacterized protein n=1 Tax=Klebsiella phage KA TaxID=3109000 RepID=A0ABZ0ZXL5_9CAUD|nr:hypothetical protein [Klebsiella phage KA]
MREAQAPEQHYLRVLGSILGKQYILGVYDSQGDLVGAAPEQHYWRVLGSILGKQYILGVYDSQCDLVGAGPRTQHRPTEALWCALAGPTSAPPPPKLTLGTH